MRAQRRESVRGGRAAVDMRRARSVTGPLRRAHPASGATWNVQVVRGKMSSQCLWHACRALSAGLLLMLLGGAMAVIENNSMWVVGRWGGTSCQRAVVHTGADTSGLMPPALPVELMGLAFATGISSGYYADTLSVAQEIRGNATISVKDEARGFHLNNLSYAGPIVMGFGGFIVVAACVMTFEARDSAAKVTPARPQSLPRPVPRRGAPCAAPARLDQLGVYRLPHVLPLPHALPLAPLHRYRPPHTTHRTSDEKTKSRTRFGSAPDLRAGSGRAALPASALRRPLRRYALSVDEPPQSAVSASAAESECGSQSSLALDLHGSGACAGVTLRVRDNTRRRPLARQQRLREDALHPTPGESINNTDDLKVSNVEEAAQNSMDMAHLSLEGNDKEMRARSAPPAPAICSPPPSPRLVVTPCTLPTTPLSSDTCILIEQPEIETFNESPDV